MGAITSKYIDDLVDSSKTQGTPKMVKHIPFDPRSPSDHITRTPLTTLDSTDSGVDTTPADAKTVRVIDPRSPNDEVTRTPIIVENTDLRHRPHAIRPKTLMKLDSLSKCADGDSDGEKQDPRSPTTKVPRTPLEDKALELDPSHFNEKEEVSEVDTENESTKQENRVLVKKLFPNDGPVDKVRRPLAAVQNSKVTPKDLLQAKHCRNVEDEYNKTHKSILSKLPEPENTVQSNTEFVETI